MDAIERALEDITDWTYFERLCCRVLKSKGYEVDPRGGSGDAGRDAIEGDGVTFQFSLRERTAEKLEEELDRYRQGKKAPKEYVYATSQEASAKLKDDYTKRFAELGMKLLVCDRAWLSTNLGADRLAHLRNELLAQTLINTPEIIRIALRTPLRSSMLGVLESAAKDSLTDERLRRVRALMGSDRREAEKLLVDVLGQGALPKDQEFEAHTHLGNVLFATGRTQEAKAEWERAIALGGASQTPAANLATTLLICEHNNSAAREVIEEGLTVDPRSAALLNVKGLLDWEAAKRKDALELFRKAYSIEQRPEFLMNEWNVLAEETGEAPTDEDIEKALDRYPAHKELLLLFANRMLDRFQATHEEICLQNAGEALTKAFPVDLARVEKERDRSPISPLDWEWMACALNTMAAVVYWQGDLRRAESLIQLAIMFEETPLFHFSAGQVQIAMGRMEQAISSFEKAANLGFDKSDLWCQLGNGHYVLFRRTGDERHLKGAADAYEKGAEKNPAILVNLAQLCWDTGARDKAKEVVALALKATPNDPVALCNSLLYSCEGNPANVLVGMPPIEAAHPTNPTVLTMMGESHYRLGNWAWAYAYFIRAAEAAGPNSFLLDQVYPLAAKALKRRVGGERGSLAAMEFLLKATKRLPESAAIQQTLQALAADSKLA